MRTGLLVISVGTIFAFSFNGLGTSSQSSDETIEEIIAAVSAVRESIQEFDARYTFTRIKGGGNVADTETQHFRYLDGLVHLYLTYTSPNVEMVPEFNLGYDGEVRWQRRADSASIVIAKGPQDAKGIGPDSQTGGFTNMMLWYPCHIARTGTLHVRDLLSMLASGNAVVRPQMEWVGDAQCVVVEFGDAYGKEFTVWLDPERGYLPVLQTSAGVDYQLRIDEALEVAPGIWMPTVGTRLVGARKDVPELAVASEYRMEVEFVSVNAGVLQPADFDHMNWAPPGTIVTDFDTGSFSIVSANNFSEAADVVLARASMPDEAIGNDSPAVSPAAPWRNPYWLALIIGCGLTSAWLVRKGRR